MNREDQHQETTFAKGIEIQRQVPLKEWTSFHIGGPADYFYSVKSIEELYSVLQTAAHASLDVHVLGKGSNVLVSDLGLRGLTLHFGTDFARITPVAWDDAQLTPELKEAALACARQDNLRRKQGYMSGLLEEDDERKPEWLVQAPFGLDDLDETSHQKELEAWYGESEELIQAHYGIYWVEAGIALADLSEWAAEAGRSGLEFARGIPGSFGGATYMNAGAYGGTMDQVIFAAEGLSLKAPFEPCLVCGEDLDFGYRHSYFMKTGTLMTRAALVLRQGDVERSRQLMADYQARRTASQPLEYPSAGSVFKRPEGYFAGKLIMDAGLKGTRVGGAEVSTKHAGFIVNPHSNASAKDVLDLVELIQKTVRKSFGVSLERELRLMGDFDLTESAKAEDR